VNPLRDEVLDMLQRLGRPAHVDEITRRVTKTRHASCVQMALRDLEGRHRVRFGLDGPWQCTAPLDGTQAS